jgi:hypothetical protein
MSHASRNAVDMSDIRVKAALETLGGDPGLLSYSAKLKAGKVWMAYGNKSSDKGTLDIFCDENVQKEYVLLPDQVYDESKSFAPCFEATLKEVEKAQEVLDTSGNNNYIQNINRISRVFPNPAKGILWVITDKSQEPIKFYSLTGREIDIEVLATSRQTFRLNLEDLTQGMYLLKVGTETHRIIVE